MYPNKLHIQLLLYMTRLSDVNLIESPLLRWVPAPRRGWGCRSRGAGWAWRSPRWAAPRRCRTRTGGFNYHISLNLSSTSFEKLSQISNSQKVVWISVKSIFSQDLIVMLKRYSFYLILWLPWDEGKIVTISNKYTNKQSQGKRERERVLFKKQAFTLYIL